MRGRAGRGDPGFYPERDPGREAPLDRLAGALGALVRRCVARGLRPAAPLAGAVAGHAARFRAAGPAAQVAELRYRLRRDGLAGSLLAECFGLYAATLPPGAQPLHPLALDAAAALVGGAVVDLADERCRRQALALAAGAFALCGVPVHLHAASEQRATEMAELLRSPLGALGLGVAAVAAGMRPAERRVGYGAAVTCSTPRVVALDYLRDRLLLGRRLRPLQSRLERLAGDTTSGGQLPLLNGLHCALLEDVDQILVDEARLPLTINADAEASPDRLPFEQALELTGALEPGVDFDLAEGGVKFTQQGAQRLGELSILLGGVWAARQTREDLVAAALVARHAMERGRDYEVAQGTLQLPAAGAGDAGPTQAVQRLLEVKEGLPFAGRHDVLARLSVPQFFRRYLRLAGTCVDARGLEGELWSAYGLRAARAGEPAAAPAYAVRAFVGVAQRRAALLASVVSHAARGDAVVVAVRSAAEAGALASALQQAGTRFVVLRGQPSGEERAALDSLGRPGTVALSLFPAQRGAARAASAEAPLHLVVAELHEARRHVAQIERAYAAASCEQFVALEDEGMAARVGGVAMRLARRAARDGELDATAAARFARAAQRGAERVAARSRRDLRVHEQVTEDLLAFSGRPK